MNKITHILVGSILLMSACTKQFEDSIEYDNPSSTELLSDLNESITVDQKRNYLEQFAKILSKAVALNKDVRDFLKESALKRIDNDYNVFYPIVKDTYINGQSFESILTLYADNDQVLSEITAAIPLLNIHIPELLDNKVADINTEDNELPVLYDHNLYYEGELVDTFGEDEVPSFNLLVITESSSIRKKTSLSKRMNELSLNEDYEYVDDYFDPKKVRKPIVKTSGYENYSTSHNLSGYFYQSNLEEDLLNAFNISQNKKEATRTVMYYNWNSIDDTKNTIRPDVKDCIFRFRLNPHGFDDYEKTISDKNVFEKNTIHKKSGLSREQVLKNLLEGEAFKFKFIVEYNSSSSTVKPRTIVFYVKPDELYDFYINESYQHATKLGRHSKYTYTLDKEKTCSKWYYPMEHDIDTRLERWDLQKDAISKYITVYLEHKDAGATITKNEKYTQTKAISGKLGLVAEFKLFVKAGINGELNASKTNQQEVNLSYTYSPKDIFLGDITVNYFDDYPIEKIYRGRVYFNDFGSGELTINVIPVSNSYWSKMRNKSIF